MKKLLKTLLCSLMILANVTMISAESTTTELDAVIAQVEMLNEEEYSIVIEHVVYGKSLKELSKVFKCNSNTLKSKYLRAINKLKEKGGDYFG